MLSVCASILWLQSGATGKRFPSALFSADTDMATDGWISLTSAQQNDIVLAQLTTAEYLNAAASAAGFIQAESRINRALARSDLRCVWLIRVEQRGPSARGLSFQAFRQRAPAPPRLFYRDIFSPQGEAEQISSETPAEFERAGGRITLFGP